MTRTSKWSTTVALLAFVVTGMLPTMSYAQGSGPSNPALTGVTQNWDKNLPSASRFTVLSAFGGAAVRDNNTGLVWEQAPDNSGGPLSSGHRTWLDSLIYCANKSVGGTVGWRLPSAIELKSIQDPSLPAPFVPTSIFDNIPPVIQLGFFWSATTAATTATPNAGVPTLAWMVLFDTGNLGTDSKNNLRRAWCVRGGMQESLY